MTPEPNGYEGAMTVMAPSLSEIDPDLHDQVTREAKRGKPEQMMRHVAGKVIGRVPANICKILSNGLQSGEITKITW